MDWTTVTLTIIAAVIAPSVLAWWTNRNRAKKDEADAAIRREEKRHDEERADALSQRAVDAAALLAAQQREAAAELAAKTDAKLTAIHDLGVTTHTLVNSAHTAALQETFDATTLTIVTLKEIAELKRATGAPPNGSAAVTAIAAAEAKLAGLRVKLDELQAATKLVEKQQDAQIAQVPAELNVEKLIVSADVATVSTPKTAPKEKSP